MNCLLPFPIMHCDSDNKGRESKLIVKVPEWRHWCYRCRTVIFIANFEKWSSLLFLSHCLDAMSIIHSGYTKEQMDAIHRLKNGKDHYSKLGLTRLATRDDVNKCYRKLAKILHPDKCLAAESEEAFKLLGISRDILLKEVKSWHAPFVQNTKKSLIKLTRLRLLQCV